MFDGHPTEHPEVNDFGSMDYLMPNNNFKYFKNEVSFENPHKVESSKNVSKRSKNKSVTKIKLNTTQNAKHTELQKYLRSLKNSNKLTNIDTSFNDYRGSLVSPIEVSKSYDSQHAQEQHGYGYKKHASLTSLKPNLLNSSFIEDDAYLIHPHKFLGMKTPIEAGFKRYERAHNMSISSLGIKREVSLKSKLKKHYVNELDKIHGDKETYMKFYNMKKELLPLSVKAYSYKQERFLKWRPSVRESAIMTHIRTSFDEHRLYLYSGLSNVALSEIVEMYVNDETGEVTWDTEPIQVNKPTERKQEDDFDDPTIKIGRFGATSITCNEEDPYDDNGTKRMVIYYYGGGQMYNEQIQQRECLDQIIRYVPHTSEFKTIKQSGKIHDARRYHTACRIGKYMIVHGGINNFGKILEDVS